MRRFAQPAAYGRALNQTAGAALENRASKQMTAADSAVRDTRSVPPRVASHRALEQRGHIERQPLERPQPLAG
jgi:hypothetical protein